MSELIKNTEYILGIKLPKGIEISDATNDSRGVKKNSIFFGLPGTKNHGSKYIKNALENGASVAVHNDSSYKSSKSNIFYIEDLEAPTYECGYLLGYNKVTKFLVSFYNIGWYYGAKYNYDRSLPNIHAFTGTNGKTTAAYLCHQLIVSKGALKYKEPKLNSLYIGTLGVKINNEEFNKKFSTKTTPDIFEFFKILHFYEKDYQSIENICIELSSHALDQKRLHYLKKFSTATILNIQKDHLDYHKDEKLYIKSKFQIFNHPEIEKRIINEDLLEKEKEFNYLFEEQPIDTWDINNRAKLYGNWAKELGVYKKDGLFMQTNIKSDFVISNQNKSASVYYEIEKIGFDETIFKIKFKNGNFVKLGILYNYVSDPKTGELIVDPDFEEMQIEYKFRTKIFSKYNIENLVFAITALISTNFEGSNLIEGKINDLSGLMMPRGRAEIIKDIPDNIIIDYAHNEHAFEMLLSSVSKFFKNLVIVFGCGGDRDVFKRSDMLKKAIKYSSNVIFTSDNSRGENFKDILKDAKKGNKLETVIIIEDRKEAIIRGSKLINKDDCLVILGKGHEETQEINGEIFHHSDYEVVNEIYS